MKPDDYEAEARGMLAVAARENTSNEDAVAHALIGIGFALLNLGRAVDIGSGVEEAVRSVARAVQAE
jgi:hypothetical protein